MPETINGIMGNVLQNSTQSTTITPTSPSIRNTSDWRFYEDAGLNDLTDGSSGAITSKRPPNSNSIFWIVGGVFLVVAVGIGAYFLITKKK
jgi:hypothetical protein